MTGKTHAIIAANMVWCLPSAMVADAAWLIPIAALSGLLPDLDASESMVKNLEIGVGTGKHQFSVKPFAPIAIILSSIFRHRGWLHSWVAVILVAGISTLFLGGYGAEYPAIITFAYLSHIAADALTKHGIEFLLPIKRAIHFLPKPLRVRTGGMVDSALFLVGALTIVAYSIQILQR